MQPMTTTEDFLERAQLASLQAQRLERLVREMLPRNRFYAERFAGAHLAAGDIRALEDLARLPFTTKSELLADQQKHPPYGSNLTEPLSAYTRFCQTSGTQGQPLCWLDTPASWQTLLDCWRTIYRIVEVGAADRLFFAFSFGPFLGFWTGFEAATRMGCLCLPGGGMSSTARLRSLQDHAVTVLLCTPTYALHLAETARLQGIDLKSLAVRKLIVAGEPGGSIPATRARIEDAWCARVFDHSGLTEVGPMTIECPEHPGGLHLLEADYFAEVIEPATGEPMPVGQVGELVVTTLRRSSSPLLRYRTGDLVRIDPRPCPCGRTFRRWEGGILGRTDDMIHLRGNNVYPSALENILRRFPDVAEYRIEIDRSSALSSLRIAVEPVPSATRPNLAEEVARAIRDELLFRADVHAVEPGSLPRFEMKAKRTVVSGQSPVASEKLGGENS
jgi:phenylacetate-CoA ligase